MSANVHSASLPTPTPDESQALAIAASYLKRAGITAATQLLSLTLVLGRASSMQTPCLGSMNTRFT